MELSSSATVRFRFVWYQLSCQNGLKLYLSFYFHHIKNFGEILTESPSLGRYVHSYSLVKCAVLHQIESIQDMHILTMKHEQEIIADDIADTGLYSY